MEFVSRQFCRTGSQHSSIPSCRRAFIKTNNNRRNSLALTKLFAKLTRGIFARNFADAHAIVQTVRRIVRLNENWRIRYIQAVAQPLRVRLVAKRADLHGKKSAGRIDAW